MTKHVYTDPGQVAHLWAHQIQDWARYRDNFYFQGRELFSYGEHYLVGFIAAPDVALLNADSNSVTTNGHRREASGATRHMAQHMIPDLTGLRGRGYHNALEAIAAHAGESGAAIRLADDIKAARHIFESWLGSNFADCEDSALAYLFAGLGYTEKQKAAKLASLQREADKAEAKRRAALDAANVREARRIADLSDSDFRAEWPDDSRDGTPEKAYAKRLNIAHKAAAGADLKRLKESLWERLKAYRAHAKGREARLLQARRDSLAAIVREWRAAGYPASAIPSDLDYRRDLPAAIAARVEKAREEREAIRLQEREAERRAAYAAWQAGEGKRPRLAEWQAGTPERAAIVADLKADSAAKVEAAEKWIADESASADSVPDIPYHLRQELRDAGEGELALAVDKLGTRLYVAKSERERREKEAKRAAALQAWREGGPRVESWQDSNGGALLRIRGDLLETSEGADVPLSHAMRAFPFIKGCREAGRGWRANGQQVRVGHYSLDWIDREGNFQAGCHRINWPEIERAAIQAGIADCKAIPPRPAKRAESTPQVENNAHGESWQSRAY